MCGNSSALSDESNSSSGRPAGTRRRQLEWLTNFVLVVVSLFGLSVGAGLLGFYQLHLLSFVSVEFLVVPVVLLAGGGFTLLVSVVGLVATSRRSPCLLIFYAFCLILAFLVLCGGVACSIRVIFTIYVGIDHSLALPMIKNYGNDSMSTDTWDKLHVAYRCCGAETSYELGYKSWENVESLRPKNAVPDSCCLKVTKDCGEGIFEDHNLKRMSNYVRKIHVHGCIRAMENVLKDHVILILTVFAVSGSILAMIELLGVVLACCLANHLIIQNRERRLQARKNLASELEMKARAMER